MATKTKTETKSAAKECTCGCGMPTTKEFAVGHDAKMKSSLYAIIRGEDPKNPVCPAAEGMTKAQATKYVEGRGWPMPAERKPKAEKAVTKAEPKAKTTRARKPKTETAPAPDGAEPEIF